MLNSVGHQALLASVAGRSRSHCQAEVPRLGLPQAPRSQLREASSRRASTGVVFRRRRRAARELYASEVRRRVLWARASVFFRSSWA